MMLKTAFAAVLTFFLMVSLALAETPAPLPVDKAFVFSAHVGADHKVVLEWHITPGYYLYRSQLKVMSAPHGSIDIGPLRLPMGQMRHDVLHGDFQAYIDLLTIPVVYPVSQKGVLALTVRYQGCSSAGFCYAPVKKGLKVDLSHMTVSEDLNPDMQNASAVNKSPASGGYMASFFEGRHLLVIVFSFLGVGLLLAFTPCVLPMVPILSGIIMGQNKKKSKGKAFCLSLAYVGGMAITYMIAGIVIALIGSNIQTELQRPWIIVLFSGLFVLLALSLFGFYELQLPGRFQRQITALSNRQSGGTYLGVFLMGSLSTLIVSPCVSAPLVGVLAYIGQTGDVLLGALALLSLGIGMGIPLLLIGVSADRLLPKAGPWMTWLERLFGFVMLGVAIWMLSRMIPGPVTLLLWAILLAVAAIFFGVFSDLFGRWQWFSRSIAVCIFVYGIILMIGAVEGNSDFFHPWAEFSHPPRETGSGSVFVTIHTTDELAEQLALAKKNKQPVLLDFYADWCGSCVMMDRTVFSRTDVRDALKKMVVLRLNLTQNTAFDQRMLKRFQIVGPPGMVFFNQEGRELKSPRIVGEVNAETFLSELKKVSHRAN